MLCLIFYLLIYLTLHIKIIAANALEELDTKLLFISCPQTDGKIVHLKNIKLETKCKALV